jgi:hypothetical protein
MSDSPAHHLCAATLIIFVAPPCSSSSSRRHDHHILRAMQSSSSSLHQVLKLHCAVMLSSFIAPLCALTLFVYRRFLTHYI